MAYDHGAGPTPGWQPDELAYAGRENLDADHVAGYDAKEDADAAAEVRLCQRLGLTGESVVDVVYTRYALHHLPDFWKGVALARMHRLLRPGGVLRLWDVVYGFEPAETAGRIEAWCAEYDTVDDDGWNRSDVEGHVRDEHSTFTWLLEPTVERVGFAIEDADYSADGIFAKYVLRGL